MVYNPVDHVVELLNRKFAAERSSEADAAEQDILSVEIYHPGTLWAVATKHPHVEVRACAAYIAAKILIQNHPLVKAGVREALEDSEDN